MESLRGVALLGLLGVAVKAQISLVELNGANNVDGSDCVLGSQGSACTQLSGERGICHFDFDSLLPFCRTDPALCENRAGDLCEEAMEEYREIIDLMGYDCGTRLQTIVDDGVAGVNEDAIPDDTNLDWRVGDYCADTCDWCDREGLATIVITLDGVDIPLDADNFEEHVLEELCLVAGYSEALGTGLTIFGNRENCTLSLQPQDEDPERRLLRALQDDEDTARVAIQGSLQVINGIEEDLDLEGEDSVFQSNGLGLTFVGNPNVIFDIVVERDYSDSGLGLIWFLVIVCVGLLLFCGLLVCLCCYCCKPRSAARSKKMHVVEAKAEPVDQY
mmetsp:Transcript_15803/g.60171  ORF Transcript_15803/g.60171 Transcript_15803/m.60171 type:complete len:332 (-) Transcript_15803:96-1091(-)